MKITKGKVLASSIGVIVIVAGIIIGMTLTSPQSGPTIGNKIMANKVSTVELNSIPGHNGEEDTPRCNCCDAVLIGGICPICKSECDKTFKPGDLDQGCPYNPGDPGDHPHDDPQDNDRGGDDDPGGICSESKSLGK